MGRKLRRIALCAIGLVSATVLAAGLSAREASESVDRGGDSFMSRALDLRLTEGSCILFVAASADEEDTPLKR